MRSSITFSDLEVADHHTSHRLTQSSKCEERTSLYELYQDHIIRKNIFWLCLENRICHIAFSKFVLLFGVRLIRYSTGFRGEGQRPLYPRRITVGSIFFSEAHPVKAIAFFSSRLARSR